MSALNPHTFERLAENPAKTYMRKPSPGTGGAIVLFGLMLGLALPHNARAQETAEPPKPAAGGSGAIPKELLAQLKGATVYIKVDYGVAKATGSGFVVKTEGTTAYVVTNHHVISPPGASKIRGEITAVFWSGTRQEKGTTADIVAEDPAADLAVLKVTGVANLPKPIELLKTVAPEETMPVFVFGFPLGDKLATSSRNPNLTVSRASVSSLRRNDWDQVVLVQLDGELNPGNSGGPVVDTQGRLAGVAVAKVIGSTIGFAIPPSELNRVLVGKATAASFRPVPSGEDKVEVDVEVRLADPFGQMKGVELLHGKTPADFKPNQKGQWQPLPNSSRTKLTIDGQKAFGKFTITAKNWKNGTMSVQCAYIGRDNLTVYSHLFSLQEQKAPEIAATSPGSRLRPPNASSPNLPGVPRSPGGSPPAEGGGSQRLPQPGSGKAAVETLQSGGKVEPFLAAAALPLAKMLLITTPTGFLKQYSYPDFLLQGSFKLSGGRAYHAILDGKRSRLYAVMTKQQDERRHPAMAAQRIPTSGTSELHFYDVKDILEGEAESGTELRPSHKLPLGANVAQMLMAPDGGKLFYLTSSDQPANPGQQGWIPRNVKLVRVDTANPELDLEIKLADGTDGLCMTPDGKTIYLTGSSKGHSAYNFGPFEGFVQVIDPATLQQRKRIIIEADPYCTAATNDGLLFVSGGSGQWTEISVVDMKTAMAVVSKWTGARMGSPLGLTPDGKRLCVAGISGFEVFAIPETIAGSRAQLIGRSAALDSSGSPGPFYLTPDGKFAISHWGNVVRLSADASSSANDASPVPQKPQAPKGADEDKEPAPPVPMKPKPPGG
jgi:S1-C subfamily serine protease